VGVHLCSHDVVSTMLIYGSFLNSIAVPLRMLFDSEASLIPFYFVLYTRMCPGLHIVTQITPGRSSKSGSVCELMQ